MYIDDKVMISLDDSLGMDEVNSISKADLISGKVFGFFLCHKSILILYWLKWNLCLTENILPKIYLWVKCCDNIENMFLMQNESAEKL